jgi:hypothetical protein
VRQLAAINRVRQGESKTLSAAAKAERTTVHSIQKNFPAALIQSRGGGRIRVKAGDPYSALVEIITYDGPLVVNARGSRERELAGRHRSVWRRVVRNELPSGALQEFRGAKVGGHKLLSNSDRLFTLAHGGELDQLDALYVIPETRG